MNTLVVLFVLVLVLALLVPWLPAGQFAPGVPVSLQSFRYADAPALQLFASGEQVGFLNFLFEGLTSGGRSSGAVGVIALLLIVGGSFAMVEFDNPSIHGIVKIE